MKEKWAPSTDIVARPMIKHAMTHEPAEFTPEWTEELRRRLADMKGAETRGDTAGVVMSVDDLIQHVRATADTDE